MSRMTFGARLLGALVFPLALSAVLLTSPKPVAADEHDLNLLQVNPTMVSVGGTVTATGTVGEPDAVYYRFDRHFGSDCINPFPIEDEEDPLFGYTLIESGIFSFQTLFTFDSPGVYSLQFVTTQVDFETRSDSNCVSIQVLASEQGPGELTIINNVQDQFGTPILGQTFSFEVNGVTRFFFAVISVPGSFTLPLEPGEYRVFGYGNTLCTTTPSSQDVTITTGQTETLTFLTTCNLFPATFSVSPTFVVGTGTVTLTGTGAFDSVEGYFEFWDDAQCTENPAWIDGDTLSGTTTITTQLNANWPAGSPIREDYVSFSVRNQSGVTTLVGCETITLIPASPPPSPVTSPSPSADVSPSPNPTVSPSPIPSLSPMPSPSPVATSSPSPVSFPSASPSPSPLASPSPTLTPTAAPTAEPPVSPTPRPTVSPSLKPSPSATAKPTASPSPPSAPTAPTAPTAPGSVPASPSGGPAGTASLPDTGAGGIAPSDGTSLALLLTLLVVGGIVASYGLRRRAV